jgi:hypothetical protein
MFTQPFEQRCHVSLPAETHGLGLSPVRIRVYMDEGDFPAHLVFDSLVPRAALVGVVVEHSTETGAINVYFFLPQSGYVLVEPDVYARIAEEV